MNALLVVISNRLDVSADSVIIEAQAAGIPTLRLNTEQFPMYRASFSLCGPPLVTISAGPRRLLPGAQIGVWFRRPEAPSHQDWSNAERAFVAEQWQDFVEGLEAVPDIVWMSRPSRIRFAENKIRQLVQARALGFQVPDTIVTNDRSELEAFRTQHRRVVVKPLAGGLLESAEGESFIFARELSATESPHEAELGAAPVVLQELIEADAHLRLTVVGDSILPALVQPGATTSGVDWRRSSQPPGVERVSIPPAVYDMARSLAHAFELAYSSMDIVRRGSEFFFLDLNPNGEWGWLESLGGVPVSSHIVAFFASRLRV